MRTRSPFTSAPASRHSQSLRRHRETRCRFPPARVGIALDQRKPFIVEHFVDCRSFAQDERHRLAGSAPDRCAPLRAAAPLRRRRPEPRRPARAATLNQRYRGSIVSGSAIECVTSFCDGSTITQGSPIVSQLTMRGAFRPFNARQPLTLARQVLSSTGDIAWPHPVAFSGMRVAFEALFANSESQ
jgi:hypothetical protein